MNNTPFTFGSQGKSFKKIILSWNQILKEKNSLNKNVTEQKYKSSQDDSKNSNFIHKLSNKLLPNHCFVF